MEIEYHVDVMLKYDLRSVSRVKISEIDRHIKMVVHLKKNMISIELFLIVFRVLGCLEMFDILF